MKGISERLSNQLIEWIGEAEKAGRLLTLIEKLSNANSLEGWIAFGFDIYENYNHCFTVSFFPYKATKEMSERENQILEEIHTITYSKEILRKIEVFMKSSLDVVKECEYVREDCLRIHFD